MILLAHYPNILTFYSKIIYFIITFTVQNHRNQSQLKKIGRKKEAILSSLILTTLKILWRKRNPFLSCSTPLVSKIAFLFYASIFLYTIININLVGHLLTTLFSHPLMSLIKPRGNSS